MKRQFGLLLASALLVCSLAACGGDRDAQQDSGQDQAHDSILDDAEDAVDDAKDTLEDAGDAILDPDGTQDHRDEDLGKRPSADAGQADSTSAGTADSGTAVKRTGLDLMLHNARVHDTDGFLKDGENPVTPGAA